MNKCNHTCSKVAGHGSPESGLGGHVPEGGQQGVQFLGGVQPRHLARRQQAVNQLQERRLHKLVVLQQQDQVLTLYTGQLHHLVTKTGTT